MLNALTLTESLAMEIGAQLRPSELSLFSGTSPRLDLRSPLARARELIFQPSATPYFVDPELYRDAQGPTNPAGDRVSLFRFHQLVDPVPLFIRDYLPSELMADNVYGQIVSSATLALGAPGGLGRLLSAAQQNFDAARLDDMSGAGTRYCPAYATPEDWYEPDAAYSRAEVSPESPSPVPGMTILPGSDEIPWRLENRTGITLLDGLTIIHQIKFDFRVVWAKRPWLDSLLFEYPNWTIPGIAPGFYSSGLTTENQGFFPLLIIGFVIAKNLRIEAEWSEIERRLIDHIRRGRVRATLGPFAIGDGPGGDPDSVLRRILPHELSTSLLAEPWPDVPDVHNDPMRRLRQIRPQFPESVPLPPHSNPNVVSYKRPQIIAWMSRLIPLCPQPELA